LKNNPRNLKKLFSDFNKKSRPNLILSTLKNAEKLYGYFIKYNKVFKFSISIIGITFILKFYLKIL